MLVTSFIFFLFINGCSLGDLPPCYSNGTTWHGDDVEDVITNVDNIYFCQESCARAVCSGFTWYSQEHNYLPLVCYVFHTTTTAETCNDCISGPASCTCSDLFSCVVTSDNVIDVFPSTQTETQCQNICYSTPECAFYTYFNHQSVIEGSCYIFSSCDQIDDTCVGCFSGPPVCTSTTTVTARTTTSPLTTETATTTTVLPTSTTTPITRPTTSPLTTGTSITTTVLPTSTTTPITMPTTSPLTTETVTTSIFPPTTTTNNVCEGISYQTLDDETRNVEYHGSEKYCDHSGADVSPDWRGPGWYRILPDAGKQLPEYPPDVYSCGTDTPGWLDGQHPQVPEEEVERRVCFNWFGDKCIFPVSISIINCGTFFLYNLTQTNGCIERYCTV